MADTRGVFSIKLVSKIDAKGGWVDLNDVWITPSSGISTYRFSDGTLGTPPAPTPTPQTYDGNPVIV